MSLIIVGGGMTGAILALALSSLAQGKIPVTLIEASRPEPQPNGFDAFAIALSQGTCQQLVRLDIWPALANCATAIKHIRVSDRGHIGSVNLRAQDYAVAALGYVIELNDARQRLFALLDHAAGVSLYCPARVSNVTRTPCSVILRLDTGEQLQSQLMVAADGSSSSLARACHIRWQQQDYQQMAVTAHLMTAQHHEGCAFERFTSSGPLALLPGRQGSSFLVWCHGQANHQEVAAWDDAHFLYQLQQAFGWRLGKIWQTGKRHNYPLRLMKASAHISHRLALVGNAAQTLHPVAGQGFNLALRDVMVLAEVLAQAAQQGDDVGAWSVLERYQARRRRDQQTTISITDGLIDLFANCHRPLIVGRNSALMVMEHLPIMRDLFARHTLGWIKH